MSFFTYFSKNSHFPSGDIGLNNRSEIMWD